LGGARGVGWAKLSKYVEFFILNAVKY